MIQRRAQVLSFIRAFFAQRGIVEVDTPVLSHCTVTDVHIASLTTDYSGPGGGKLYLQTSPEFAMKRLLAAGSGPIYQIARVFRDGEAGRLHNPEFAMVEWYRPGFDHHKLMDEVELLVASLLMPGHPDPEPAERLTYTEAFRRYADVDPLEATADELSVCAAAHGIPPGGCADREDWLDLILAHVVAPRLGAKGMTFLHEFPSFQAALARRCPHDSRTSERFELFVSGMELANGYHELADPREQLRRFEADQLTRRQQGLPAVSIDRRLIAALQSGLPDCAGVALGLDRLMMVLTGASDIAEVMAFPIDRA